MDCRKHRHENNQGVCPSCLTEKLSNLSIAHNKFAIAKLNNLSNWSSSSASSSSSPVGDKRGPWNNRAGSMSHAVGKKLNDAIDDGLKKSRSMASVPGCNTRLIAKYSYKKMEKKIKKGFLSKLVHLKNDVKDKFMHSRG